MHPKRKCSIEGCTLPHDAKGYCRQHYARWKRHGNPLIAKQASPGSGWIQRGYKYVTVNGRNVRAHIAIAARALGKPLPPGAVVHHADENRLNNAPGNLVICPNEKYHNLLHIRMAAHAACGNWGWRKCTFCKNYDDPNNMREEKSGRCVHRKCSALAKRTGRQNAIHI